MIRIVILLMFISLVGSAQYEPTIMLDKSKSDVKDEFYRNQPNYQLIYKDNVNISYYNWREDFTIIYSFNNSVCIKQMFIIDNLRGEELIGYHHKDWEPHMDFLWLYKHPSYNLPLLVRLYYSRNNRMVFVYTKFTRNSLAIIDEIER